MDLDKIMNKDCVVLDADVKERGECIRILSERLLAAEKISDLDVFMAAVEEREVLSSTYCTMQIAIPHGITPVAKTPALCFMRCREAIDWDGDGETPVRYVFLIAVPEGKNEGEENEHIQILSHVAVTILNTENQEQWFGAETPEQFMEQLAGNP